MNKAFDRIKKVLLLTLFGLIIGTGLSAETTRQISFKAEITPGRRYTHTKWFFLIPVKLTPQIACWVEDPEGKVLGILYVTEKAASGNWTGGQGVSRPEALPVFFHRIVRQEQVDAVSGATPKKQDMAAHGWGKTFNLSPGDYRVMAEVNSSFDYNEVWPKSPGNVNGQPSVLYAAEIHIDASGRVPRRPVILQAIGHGDPEGLNGEIVPELDSLTTALEQLKKITVTLED